MTPSRDGHRVLPNVRRRALNHFPSREGFAARECFAAATVLALAALPISFDFASRTMIGDGLLYGNIAAMLAEGQGAFWRLPYFDANVAAFYDHPPLGIYLQSLLIELIDHRHTAIRLYMLAVMVAFFAAFWLLVRSKPCFGGADEEAGPQDYWWAVFVLCVMPPTLRVLEGNYLDGLLATTSMVAVWFGLRAVRGGAVGPAIATALWVYVGLLIKGPMALFPLIALPCILLVVRRSAPVALAFAAVATAAVAMLCIVTWLADADARLWLENYWTQQVKASILGERDEGYQRGYALWRMVRNLGAGLAVALIFAFATGQRHVRWRRETTVWMVIGLSASLPLLLSSRNYGHYLMSATPYFALAIAGAVPAMRLPSARILRIACIVVWALVLGIVAANWGIPGDDEHRITTVRKMAELVAPEETIVYCPDRNEFTDREAAYLYRDHGRRHYMGLDRVPAGTRFWLVCDYMPQGVIELNRTVPAEFQGVLRYMERL